MKADHYNIAGREECLVEMYQIFGRDRLIAFCELNAYKYEYRKDHKKQAKTDLEKALFYKRLHNYLDNNPHVEIKTLLNDFRQKYYNE